MKITTVNVNGIRAAYRKGMGQWLAATAPDVLLCQETRAPEELIGELIGDEYQVIAHECQIKGRAGVAVAVRNGIEVGEVHTGVGEEEPPVDTGRWLEVELPGEGVTVVSAYLHSGKADDEAKMAAKYAHLEKVSERLAKMSGEFVVCGDFNIVHTAADITNWKSNHNKTSGVLDPEIAYLDRWFTAGLVDVQRFLDPESQGPYTWWSQRGKAFDNNVGWRIDYHMASPALAKRASSYSIDRAASYDARWSDHAALTVNYEN
ncbi:exodeoxyribonuclease-3 [Arcanobacterium wilhelmae]|uniref:Exodeoxyribonuclease-3 n=1 Tax=Arcanobacterium wilhelmae TaxID=1803177 RepID=A0ABT9NCP9_9ACTO|nr:exodeoxyribonuclease III [Arcanobacterium wilhelmae]MDP9801463.1 exodeoxyribonuclease-3 [Arcanobacterium wilhelmae]WFN90794.1 exodeoxyribonuclease III [Arcanobacterium wilhelmae]